MKESIDARGLSCPQPVLDTLAKIEAMGSGELEVLVDTEASKENVSRAVQAKGWRVESITEDNGEYCLKLAGD
ncbi:MULTISPECIES: sulfurtransferase TusA family protein [unclassified Pseudodesulfovibrio]|uniref:sulfurtransferase TusA family protein n=1 Tax=unclassified Pseudodesulfovibrio TaxID=2661612 RepID=UPI000FEB7DB0|nr:MULTISPECIES: sulfurtransferase TusA family protein [unclassified Pseudodesulfovibrio]MCJ2163618.1 sulfurtransferase TusA family protein [Pseudodesulfovibrio sp. S3-i]RWU06848.1 preprotein translocase subunit TatB [Pseudodesulfovibrio sp. S3]